jgi:hypothetical protein
MNNVVKLQIFDPTEGLICTFKHPTVEEGRTLYRTLSADLRHTRYQLVLIGPDGKPVEGEAPPTGSRNNA